MKSRFPTHWLRAGILTLACWSALTGRAHDFFTAYVQHRAELSIGVEHIDLTVRLTFFEDGSEHERAEMDRNQDGRVSRQEVAAYLEGLKPEFEQAVTLEIGGRPVPLLELYAPELDLMGDDRVVRGHHRLELRYFARTPPSLKAGARLVVRDSLWPASSRLGSIQLGAKDGCRLELLSTSARRDGPDAPKAGNPLTFKIRVVVPPVKTDK